MKDPHVVRAPCWTWEIGGDFKLGRVGDLRRLARRFFCFKKARRSTVSAARVSLVW